MHQLPTPRLGLLICGWVVCAAAAWAQLGTPKLQQYDGRDYRAGAANYAVAQSAEGLLYVANADTLLQYDGATWRAIGSEVRGLRHLVLGPDSLLYGLAQSAVGVVAPADRGQVCLRRLAIDRPPEGELLHVFATPGGVYAVYTRGVVRLYRGRATRCVEQAQAYRNRPPLEALVHYPLWGLTAAVGDTVAPYLAVPLLQGQAVVALLAQPGFETVVVLADGRTYRFNGWVLRPLRNEAQTDLANGQVTQARLLPGRYLALGTLRSGLFVLDKYGREALRLGRLSGLQNETVFDLHPDNEGGLWLALESGLSRAELLAPLTFFDADAGLQGGVNALASVADTLFAATDRGIYWLDSRSTPARFVAVPGVVGQAHCLVRLGARLLAGTETGLYSVNTTFARRVRRYPVYSALVRPGRSPAVLLGTARGLAQATLAPYRGVVQRTVQGRVQRSYGWIDSVAVAPLGAERLVLRGLSYGPGRTLWGSTADSSYRLGLKLLPARRYGRRRIEPKDTVIAEALPPAAGLPSLGGVHLVQLGTDLAARVGPTLYRYAPKANSFGRDTSLVGELPVHFVHQDAWNDRLVLTTGGLRYYGSSPYRRSGYQWDSTSIALPPDAELRTAYRPTERQYWLGLSTGLVRYEPKRPTLARAPYTVWFREVLLNGTDTVFAGGVPASLTPDTLQWAPLRIVGHRGATRVGFAGSQWDPELPLAYRWALVGPRDTLRWTAYSPRPEANLYDLPYGRYQLLVQARDPSGRTSRTALLPLVLRPHWYATWWARALQVLLGLGLAGGLGLVGIRLYTRGLKQRNARLAHLVEERTQEIATKNHELEQYTQVVLAQKAQIELDKLTIEQKNRDITDSITYARRIQEAMLPRREWMQHRLPEHFVFYRPRDIVSGDFYWFDEVDGQQLLAVGDCTGHGVPGALMAMIGTTLLTRIVNEQQVREPAEILARLHHSVRSLLGLDEAPTTDARDMHLVRDGMDICLVRLDPASGTLDAASANRPLWHIRSGELIETKGDRQHIGGHAEAQTFTTHRFPLTESGTLYLFSDGVVDQFGGSNHTRFQSRRMRELLLSVQDLPLSQQATAIEAALAAWMQATPQLDDMLMIGLRV